MRLFFDKDVGDETLELMQELVNIVLSKHGNKTDAELKTAAYLTKPMRSILKLEKEHHLNMFNSPIDLLAA